MAWDFSTEPEFQAHLDWMVQFVRDEVWPFETLNLDQGQLDRALRPLAERVRERGLWAAHLPPALAGQGFGSCATCRRWSTPRRPSAGSAAMPTSSNGAQVLHDVIDRALQVHGSLGYSTDMPLEAMYQLRARGAPV